jgi:hypothetical protein
MPQVVDAAALSDERMAARFAADMAAIREALRDVSS